MHERAHNVCIARNLRGRVSSFPLARRDIIAFPDFRPGTSAHRVPLRARVLSSKDPVSCVLHNALLMLHLETAPPERLVYTMGFRLSTAQSDLFNVLRLFSAFFFFLIIYNSEYPLSGR